MIIRKITEYSGAFKTEKILLLSDKNDEGWDMTGDELRTLRDLIDRVYSPAVSPPAYLHSNESPEEIYKLNEEINKLTGLIAANKVTIDMRNDRIKQLEVEIKDRGAIIDRAQERYDNLNKDYQSLGNQINELAFYIMNNVKGEPSRSEGAVETAIRLLKIYQEDHAAECPDYIEPPEIPESQENLEITEVPIIAEKYTEVPGIVPETAENVHKNAKKDFSRYIQMANDKVNPKEIQFKMIDDWGISEGTALNYYYTRVKPKTVKIDDQEIEVEKKAAEKELEPKIQRKDDATNKEKALMQEIAALPEFKTPDDFLVHALVYEIGIDKKGKDLKEIYLKTHPGTKW